MTAIPATIPMPEPEQPLPMAVKIWSECIMGIERQVIARTWHQEDWRNCRLCPKGTCNVRDNLCMVAYGSIAPLESSALRARIIDRDG